MTDKTDDSLKKDYVKNLILVMSGGVGERFGGNCPKQYNIINGRMVIDYVIDACRNSLYSDQIVIVARDEYVQLLKERYALPVVEGGDTRPKSVANGLKFIKNHYPNCEKLIITNAVCPLATTEQYDKYFSYLDSYDFVLTCWKLAPALHRFDEIKVDRDDFFNIMEPDAYNFNILYQNFDFKNLKKYIFHNMPDTSSRKYCFDYPYTTKLTYATDLDVIKVLYERIVENKKREKTLNLVNDCLSGPYNNTDVHKWSENITDYLQEISNKYGIINISIDPKSHANLVYKAESLNTGTLYIKFCPNKNLYRKEYLFYKLASHKIVPELYDYNDDYNCLITKAILPGISVKFSEENNELRAFFDYVFSKKIPSNQIPSDYKIPFFLDDFNEYVLAGKTYSYKEDYRNKLEKIAIEIYEKYFGESPLYFIHRDLQRNNILQNDTTCLAIDPRGAVAPIEFEFTSMFIAELRGVQIDETFTQKFNRIFNFFLKYTDEKKLYAALFIFWVYKINDYLCFKKDNRFLCNWAIDSLEFLFIKKENNRVGEISFDKNYKIKLESDCF